MRHTRAHFVSMDFDRIDDLFYFQILSLAMKCFPFTINQFRSDKTNFERNGKFNETDVIATPRCRQHSFSHFRISIRVKFFECTSVNIGDIVPIIFRILLMKLYTNNLHQKKSFDRSIVPFITTWKLLHSNC